MIGFYQQIHKICDWDNHSLHRTQCHNNRLIRNTSTLDSISQIRSLYFKKQNKPSYSKTKWNSLCLRKWLNWTVFRLYSENKGRIHSLPLTSSLSSFVSLSHTPLFLSVLFVHQSSICTKIHICQLISVFLLACVCLCLFLWLCTCENVNADFSVKNSPVTLALFRVCPCSTELYSKWCDRTLRGATSYHTR